MKKKKKKKSNVKECFGAKFCYIEKMNGSVKGYIHDENLEHRVHKTQT